MKILFVCKANVGRSQMAEAFARNLGLDAISAGTDVGEKSGRKIGDDEKARFVWEAMNEEGIDVRNYIRKQLTADLVTKADKIIVMTEKQFCPDYLLSSKKAGYWEISDAKGTDYQTHLRTRDEIKRRVLSLTGAIK